MAWSHNVRQASRDDSRQAGRKDHTTGGNSILSRPITITITITITVTVTIAITIGGNLARAAKVPLRYSNLPIVGGVGQAP